MKKEKKNNNLLVYSSVGWWFGLGSSEASSGWTSRMASSHGCHLGPGFSPWDLSGRLAKLLYFRVSVLRTEKAREPPTLKGVPRWLESHLLMSCDACQKDKPRPRVREVGAKAWWAQLKRMLCVHHTLMLPPLLPTPSPSSSSPSSSDLPQYHAHFDWLIYPTIP